MSFLEDSEYLILMDFNKANNEMMSSDELSAFYNAGIHTMQVYINWATVETSRGVFDWSNVDERVALAVQTGYKVLLNCYLSAPSFYPEDYYAQVKTTICSSVFSPWSKEAQACSNAFLLACCKRYGSNQVVVANSQLTMGETVFLNEPAWYDQAALRSFRERWNTEDNPSPNEDRTELWLKESYISHMMAIQSVLVENPYRDIWTALHPALAVWGDLYGNGCNFIDPIYTAYATLPDVHINQIWYTFVQHSGQYKDYKRLISTYKIRAFGGAEYCEGLQANTPIAKKMGFRGLIIHPLHPFTGHLSIEPWMLDNIKNAIEAWK